MKHSYSIFLIALIMFLPNWRSAEPSIQGNFKHNVNFYGKLKTRQGNKLVAVDNISLDKRYSQIRMKEMPQTHEQPKPITDKTGTKGIQEIKLEVDPETQLATTKIDLAETTQLIIPHPNVVWVYKKKKGFRKRKFIEIIVVSKDAKKTRSHYLVDYRTKLYCDEMNQAGPIEKEIRLPALERLIIQGYSLRDKKKPQQTPVTPGT